MRRLARRLHLSKNASKIFDAGRLPAVRYSGKIMLWRAFSGVAVTKLSFHFHHLDNSAPL
jgi:hypothetical protein